MEEERGNKFQVVRAEDLKQKGLIKLLKSQGPWLIKELEAEPMGPGFEIDYRATYWYLKYYILRDGEIELEVGDIEILFNSFDRVCYNWLWIHSTDGMIEVRVVDSDSWRFGFPTGNGDVKELIDLIG